MAFIILLSALLVAGFFLWLFHKPEGESEIPHPQAATGEECCGTHAVCEKRNAMKLAPVEYYDDEELDRFSGREAEDYTSDEIDEFRDVMLSLLPADVEGWGISLEKRGISLPSALADEYLLLLTGE